MFKKHVLNLLTLLLFVVIVGYMNHIPGTRLTGWDNIQTDLNPLLGIKRAYFSAWEEYQSFGLLAGMAHASDLSRAISTALLSLFIAPENIRYIQHMILFYGGGVGMYVLLIHVFTKRSPHISPYLTSLVGSIFYLFNYGTIQIMALPLEAFSYLFAFLPWLVWSAIQYFESTQKSTQRLFIFMIVSFLSVPLAYVQTLFVVYSLVMIILSLSFYSIHNSFRWLRKCMALWTIILVSNMFWLIPQMYFVSSGGSTMVQHAKANQIASPSVRDLNESFGTVSSFIRFEGFYTDLRGLDTKPLFENWHKHEQLYAIRILQFVFIAIIIFGIFRSSKYRFLFVGLFALVACALLTSVPGIRELNTQLLTFPLIGEMFRSPFTKFIVVYGLVSSYGLAVGTEYIVRQVPFRLKQGVPIFMILLILLTSLPAFQGNFFARDMQVALPQDYLDTMEYFKTVDPNQRIALLPDATFWGWFYTEWGYNGSGFLWYGIEQPIVSRTFDVWSESSESYYWEMKRAVESERIADVENVLNKYAIDYIILDHSLKPVSGGYEALQYDALENMLSQSPRMTRFGKGEHLSLYRYHRPTFAPSGGFTHLTPDMPVVEPATKFAQYDDAYQINGMYKSASSDTEVPDAVYPFRNLTSATQLFDDEWALTETPDAFVLIGRIPGTFPLKGMTLTSSAQADGNVSPLYEVDTATRTVTATIAKKLITTTQPSTAQLYPCSSSTNSDPENNNSTTNQNALRLDSRNGLHVCAGYDFPQLDQRKGYMFSISARNIAGRPLFMSITDSTKKQSIIEDRLATFSTPQLFMIPPHFEYGLGYIMTFQNTSYAHLEAVNRLESINVYEFPFETIAKLHLQKAGQRPPTPSLSHQDDISTTKRAYHAYTVDITHTGLKNNEFLVLNQSYHPGWKAYIVPRDSISQYIPWLVGKKLPEQSHVRINSWAQGWRLPDTCEKARGDCRIVLLFPMHYATPIGLGLWFVLLIATIHFVRKERRYIVK